MKATKKDTKQAQKEHEASELAQATAKQFQTSLIQTSWRLAVSILGFSFLGIWLDGTFDTKPVLSIIGITLGLVVSFVSVKRYIESEYPGTFGGKK